MPDRDRSAAKPHHAFSRSLRWVLVMLLGLLLVWYLFDGEEDDLPDLTKVVLYLVLVGLLIPFWPLSAKASFWLYERMVRFF